MAAESYAAAMAIAVALGLVLIVAWIALPAAVFGLKPLVRQLLSEMRAANAHLIDIKTHARHQAEAVEQLLRALKRP